MLTLFLGARKMSGRHVIVCEFSLGGRMASSCHLNNKCVVAIHATKMVIAIIHWHNSTISYAPSHETEMFSKLFNFFGAVALNTYIVLGSKENVWKACRSLGGRIFVPLLVSTAFVVGIVKHMWVTHVSRMTLLLFFLLLLLLDVVTH